MQAVVLEEKGRLAIREIALDERLGPLDVRIGVRSVGICGSDVHYLEHGHIGHFVVDEPMVLGHEASGVIIETGSGVRDLAVGDRVCMEPGVPASGSRAARLGLYNLDPDVRFWATPPVHGVLRPEVVHPAEFTFRLPENVSLQEGAMVEPLAVGMHGAMKARVRPGDVAVVMGAGTIGLVTVMAALAAGCSRVIVSDVVAPKLDLAAALGPVTSVDLARQELRSVVADATGGWGADVVFECSGSARAAASVFDVLCPGGTVVLIGIPVDGFQYDVVGAQVKEARVEHVFRYAHVYPRALALMGSGAINVRPLITDSYRFCESLRAFEFARRLPPTSVKVQIEVGLA